VNCSESTALSGLEAAARKAVNYVDVAPDANRVCRPIAPAGTCNAWVARS
jgi:hypothetical protein